MNYNINEEIKSLEDVINILERGGELLYKGRRKPKLIQAACTKQELECRIRVLKSVVRRLKGLRKIYENNQAA